MNKRTTPLRQSVSPSEGAAPRMMEPRNYRYWREFRNGFSRNLDNKLVNDSLILRNAADGLRTQSRVDFSFRQPCLRRGGSKDDQTQRRKAKPPPFDSP